MEKDYKEIDLKILNEYYLLQRCVMLEENYDYEFSNEFLVVGPSEINDMYNQN